MSTGLLGTKKTLFIFSGKMEPVNKGARNSGPVGIGNIDGFFQGHLFWNFILQ
jgi:hypothetical protein